jgi:hypothetical protein
MLTNPAIPGQEGIMQARSIHLKPIVSSVLLFLTFVAAHAQTIESQYATVDGVTLHYLSAGHGPALILLHGCPETSRMRAPAILVFAAKFTIIAPDLPVIGGSDIPGSGLNMK